MTEQSPRQPRSIAAISSTWLDLMASERATTPEGANDLRELHAEAAPYALRTRLWPNRVRWAARSAEAGPICLIEASISNSDPNLTNSDCKGPILVHPTVAAVEAIGSTIEKLENVMEGADDRAEWPTVELIGRALIEIYRAPVAPATPMPKARPTRWGRMERALPTLYQDISTAFNRHIAEVERVNNLSKTAKLASNGGTKTS